MTTYVLTGVSPLGGAPADIVLSDGLVREVAGAGKADTTGATVIDGAGLVVLPGLVDLHTHLREPGREDAETVHTGSRAAALGGFTAVHAMANTAPSRTPPASSSRCTASAGRPATSTCCPIGAVTVGLEGERLAELGAMATRAARVRVFTDDGDCVSDALLMRRALEYVKAFDGVIAQHAQEPRLTEGAQMNEGEPCPRGSA